MMTPEERAQAIEIIGAKWGGEVREALLKLYEAIVEREDRIEELEEALLRQTKFIGELPSDDATIAAYEYGMAVFNAPTKPGDQPA